MTEAPDQAALRTLQMAQRTADSAVAEAKAEADKLVSDARIRAAELEREAQTRHNTVMGQLESQRVALEARVEDLRAFEREYRTRLKAYLETQLRDLDGRAPAEAVAPAAAPPLRSVPADHAVGCPGCVAGPGGRRAGRAWPGHARAQPVRAGRRPATRTRRARPTATRSPRAPASSRTTRVRSPSSS